MKKKRILQTYDKFSIFQPNTSISKFLRNILFCNFICFLTLFQFFLFSLPKFFSKLKFYFWCSISDLIWLRANLSKKERFIYFHKLIGLYFVMKLDDLLLFIDRSSLHSSLLFIIIDHKFNIKNGQKYINISLTEKYE